MNSAARKLAFCMLFALLFAVVAPNGRSEVTGTVSTTFWLSNQPGGTMMFLASPESVDGLNGELTYDTSLFSNPSVRVSDGSKGFTALGNETSPGTFRFLLYRNPADHSLDLAKPAISFYFDIAENIGNQSIQTTVNFTSSVAARIASGSGGSSTAVTITPTTFNSFDIFIGGNAAKNWYLYE